MDTQHLLHVCLRPHLSYTSWNDAMLAETAVVCCTTVEISIMLNHRGMSMIMWAPYWKQGQLVQEYVNKWRIFKKVQPKNDLMYQDIYNGICQNTKK